LEKGNIYPKEIHSSNAIDAFVYRDYVERPERGERKVLQGN